MRKRLHYYVMFVVVFLFLYSCFAKIKRTAVITGIRITSTFPHISMKGKLSFYDSSVTSIYYCGDQIMYHSSYSFNHTPKDFMTEKPDEIRSYYFVFTKGKKKGLLFDTYKSAIPIKVPLDSMLKGEWSNSIDIYTNFQKSDLKLIDKKSNPDSGIFTYLYLFAMKSDSTFKGTILHHFNKNLNNISYSFSKEHDSTMKMKLCRVEIVNFPRYIKQYDMELDKIEQLFLLEEITVTNEKELLLYFEKEKAMNYNLK